MKNVLITTLLILTCSATLQAQDIQTIKNSVILGQIKRAKTDIDKAIVVEKIAKKAEIWVLKTIVYAALSEDSTTPKDQALPLFDGAVTAFKKYKELDPTFVLLKDPVFATAPGTLYGIYFKMGATNFNTKKDWAAAYNSFSTAVEMSDFLIANKLTTVVFDTIANLYAGASAQNMKTNDEGAIKYFTKLANAKSSDKEYEFLYQFLVNYYASKKDDPNFNKYLAISKGLYPDSKFFPAAEEEYAQSKDVYFQNLKVGEELYEKIYKDEKNAIAGDMNELENNMVAAFTKAAEAKPENAGIPYGYIGNHYINKSVTIFNDKVKKITDEISALNRNAKPDKNGKLPALPKDLLAKRDSLYKIYDQYEDIATVNFEKAIDAFQKKTPLDKFDKQFYKNSAGYLLDIAVERKNNSKNKPAELAKYTAQEKKWNDLYNSLRQ